MKTRLLSITLLLACAWRAGAGGANDNTPPTITIGLASTKSFTAMASLTDGQEVRPDASGLIRFRAKLTDAGRGVRNATITVPHASAFMFVSPTKTAYIGGVWDVRRVADGTEGEVIVVCFDYAGNKSEKRLRVVVDK